MKKYKISVYAICKNEEKFIDRWYESMKEADEICVLDTGSTDNSVKKLKKLGVNVKRKKISPWRFDIARNKSLDMVSKDTDICICTDLDEVFIKDWRKKLEDSWDDDTNRLRYTYNWSLDKDNNPIISFFQEKIHSRNGYKWTHPVHEILEFNGEKENYKTCEDLVINHYPDSNKSRSNYLPLLKLSVKEDPLNDRNMHYLGREYMYYGMWNESIDTLIKHLNLKRATWKDERCASMRFIARCYKNLKRYDEAKLWIEKAINEAPYLRDPYMEAALLYYEFKDYENVKKYCLEALKIESNFKSYINETFSWNYTVYDLLSIAYYYLNDYENSLKYVELAILKNTDENQIQRLENNKKMIIEMYNKRAN